MSGVAVQPTQQNELRTKIHNEIARLASEHDIGLKADNYKKYVDLLLSDEFRDCADASPEDIVAVLELPVIIASISKDGMQRPETLYATAFSQSRKLDAEFVSFKKGFDGKFPSLEEISLYLRFFQKKGVLEDYDRWLDENWRMGSSDPEESSDFWLSNMFMMRNCIRLRLKQSEMSALGQNKKSRIPKSKN